MCGAYSSKIMVDEAGYLNDKDIKKVLDACESKEEFMFMWLLFRTGVRISELVGTGGSECVDPLVKQRIDFDKGIIRFRNLKQHNKDSRTKKTWKSVYVDPVTLGYLTSFVQNKRSREPIFKMNRWQAYRLFQKVCKRAGFEFIGTKKAHPHIARHSFVMHGVNNNVKLKFLQDQAGHRSLQSTAQYMDFKKEDIDKEMKKMWSTT